MLGPCYSVKIVTGKNFSTKIPTSPEMTAVWTDGATLKLKTKKNQYNKGNSHQRKHIACRMEENISQFQIRKEANVQNSWRTTEI